ncbi:MAG: hypothetical protein JNJ88_04055 [Planctomycetes bacterium]|nr:hypothetical protein [Planctomycetota bacterium]
MPGAIRAVLPLALLSLTAPAWAVPSGGADDERSTIEEEILRTLHGNGVITDQQLADLTAMARRLRAERLESSHQLENAIHHLTESLQNRPVKPGVADPREATLSWDRGFVFRSNDGKFELQPWFVYRGRFTYVDVGNRTGLNNEDTGSLETRTMRLWFNGHILTENLKYLIMFDLASVPGGPAGILRDAYLDYEFAPEFHLRFGNQKRIVDREGFGYAPLTQFVDKAPVTVYFQGGPTRDFEPGLTAWGLLAGDLIEWRAGIFNGEGTNNGATAANIGPASPVLTPVNANNNDASGLETMARLTFHPMGMFDYVQADYGISKEPKLSFGGHVSHNPERNNGATPTPAKLRSEVWTYGLDAAFRMGGFFLLAEVFERKNERLSPAQSDFTDDGYFAQAGYFLGSDPNRGFELAGRWSSINIDGQSITAGSATQVHDATLGLNYLFAGHRLKIQSAYTYRVEDRRASKQIYDNIFQLQLQAVF